MSQQLPSATDNSPAGERFARAIAAKDSTALGALLADPIDFEALTPGRYWQTSSASEAIGDYLLGMWFGSGRDIRELESVRTGGLPGREHVCYRLRVGLAEGEHVVEQQAYYNTDGERITWLRILCSGYQKLPG
jgi:hypothetical protein